MKFKTEAIEPDNLLGNAGDIELALVALPMETYRALYEIANQEGKTVATVFSLAISNYIANLDKNKFKSEPKEAKIDFAFKRRK